MLEEARSEPQIPAQPAPTITYRQSELLQREAESDESLHRPGISGQATALIRRHANTNDVPLNEKPLASLINIDEFGLYVQYCISSGELERQYEVC